ncbi:unnamed protein product [Sphagnum compactum]
MNEEVAIQIRQYKHGWKHSDSRLQQLGGVVIIPVLQWIETWNHVLRGCLPGGHIMVNCGSSYAREAEGQNSTYIACKISSQFFVLGTFGFWCYKHNTVLKKRRGAFGFLCYKHNMVLKKRQEELLDFGAPNTTWC